MSNHTTIRSERNDNPEPTIGLDLAEGKDQAVTFAFNTLGFLIKFESGACSEEEIIEGFQNLINSGTINHLQGSYGRTAHQLVQAGLCTL